jgi:glycosyltransferase involved in cell wall biosynthesis
MSEDLPYVSIVIIGKNEASHLENTYRAIKEINYPREKLELIYVDSGSEDNSIKISEKYCEKIFVEPEWPSAARNRNRGLIESSNNIVHFLDGDILLDPDYLMYAVEKLQKGMVSCVFGRLVEQNTRGIGKILLHDYSNRRAGFVDIPGAGGTFIKEALLEVNGWDERIPRGEETELGFRLKQAGYKILYVEYNMGQHDYGIKGFCQYVKKQEVEGISFGAISLIKSRDKFFIQSRKIIRNNIIIHLLILSLAVLSGLINSIIPFLAGCIGFPIYVFVKYRILKGISNHDSLKYFLISNLTRTAVMYGFLKFRIEYYFMPEVNKISFHKRLNLRDILKKR